MYIPFVMLHGLQLESLLNRHVSAILEEIFIIRFIDLVNSLKQR